MKLNWGGGGGGGGVRVYFVFKVFTVNISILRLEAQKADHKTKIMVTGKMV